MGAKVANHCFRLAAAMKALSEICGFIYSFNLLLDFSPGRIQSRKASKQARKLGF